ncbi:hypothetical protein IE077_001093, partial [Cardiosporidium cionae]
MEAPFNNPSISARKPPYLPISSYPSLLHSPYFHSDVETSPVSTTSLISLSSATPSLYLSVERDATSPASFPEELEREKKRDVAEALIVENLFDYSAWDSLLTLPHTNKLYERILEVFPTCPRYWQLYAEFEIRNGQIMNARSIYKRSVTACGDVALWKSYIKFIFHTGSLYEIIQGLEDAIAKIGMDHRSYIFWKEVLLLRIKMYNTEIIKRESTQGLLNDPLRQSSTGASLLPTLMEQEWFGQLLPHSDIPLYKQYAEISQMRLFYHEWLSTATENMSLPWTAYCHFEMIVGSNSALAKKLISEYELHYTAAKETFIELVRIYENLDTSLPAIPLTKQNVNSLKSLQVQWKAILDYEKANPLQLSVFPLQKRIQFCYQNCLLNCAYHADVWCDYFQFLLSHKQSIKALDILRIAIDRFLLDDELLKLIICHFLEENHQIEAVKEVYQSMLSIKPTAVASADTTLHATSGFGSPIVILNYLAFLRRIY